MSQSRPIPSPRTKFMENLDLPPPLPPKPILKENKIRQSKNTNKTVIFNESIEVLESESIVENLNGKNYEQVSVDDVEFLSVLNLPPPLPPRPKSNSRLSKELDEILEIHKPDKDLLKIKHVTNNDNEENISVRRTLKDDVDKPSPRPRRNINSNSDSECNIAVEVLELNNKNKLENTEIQEKTPSLPPKPKLRLNSISRTVSKGADTVKSKEQAAENQLVAQKQLIVQHPEFLVFDLKGFLQRFLESELQYIRKLEEALDISQEFQLTGLPDSTILNFFGSLKSIHKLHKEIFYKDLKLSINEPIELVSCFAKHASKFPVYIERQWLVPKEADLTEFEIFLINERDLKEYLEMTKNRVAEYIKMLTYLKSCTQYCPFKDCKEYLLTINEAIGVVENLFYQLEITENLQNVKNICNKFKECGQVYLNNTFKVSVDGKKRHKYHVYFCEKLILFATLEENGSYRYFDDIPTLECYGCILKNKSVIFEIGIKNKKRYILKADSQNTRDKWCEKLKQVLRTEVSEV